MTVLATLTPEASVAPDAERIIEILARIDRGGLHIPEAELRHTLVWNDVLEGDLLGVLAELEAQGLIESTLCFRLTDHGRRRLPADYAPLRRYAAGIPWRRE